VLKTPPPPLSVTPWPPIVAAWPARVYVLQINDAIANPPLPHSITWFLASAP